jgi:hypothetical protein
MCSKLLQPVHLGSGLSLSFYASLQSFIGIVPGAIFEKELKEKCKAHNQTDIYNLYL